MMPLGQAGDRYWQAAAAVDIPKVEAAPRCFHLAPKREQNSRGYQNEQHFQIARTMSKDLDPAISCTGGAGEHQENLPTGQVTKDLRV